MALAAADVRGLREFRLELKRLDSTFPKALRQVHKTIADREAMKSRLRASAAGGVQARASSAIKGYASQRESRIGVLQNSSNPMANVAYWGAKKRTGWYAKRRYADSPPQHPPWVGSSWLVAVRGQGPYAINETLADDLDEILEEYLDMISAATRAAFPQGA